MLSLNHSVHPSPFSILHLRLMKTSFLKWKRITGSPPKSINVKSPENSMRRCRKRR
nr:hypothetical protein I308_03208 [Cryptococcus tetragattii IND107]